MKFNNPNFTHVYVFIILKSCFTSVLIEKVFKLNQHFASMCSDEIKTLKEKLVNHITGITASRLFKFLPNE